MILSCGGPPQISSKNRKYEQKWSFNFLWLYFFVVFSEFQHKIVLVSKAVMRVWSRKAVVGVYLHNNVCQEQPMDQMEPFVLEKRGNGPIVQIALLSLIVVLVYPILNVFSAMPLKYAFHLERLVVQSFVLVAVIHILVVLNVYLKVEAIVSGAQVIQRVEEWLSRVAVISSANARAHKILIVILAKKLQAVFGV
jgi:hypothetical protein